MSYHHTIGYTPVQAVFGKDIIFNLASVVDWRVITAKKHRQVKTDNVCKNNNQVSDYYVVGDLIYMDMTGI